MHMRYCILHSNRPFSPETTFTYSPPYVLTYVIHVYIRERIRTYTYYTNNIIIYMHNAMYNITSDHMTKFEGQ